jgi:LysR family transcriptional regulator, glycine cleavage system transcriptional activator
MQKSQQLTSARRALPSLRAVVAFEAAARTESFAKAARELSLSQSAISRQVAQLEQTLGVALFSRVRQRVVLTPAGALFAERVREIVARLRASAEETMAFQGRGGVLRLGVLPTFSTRWLIPRLPDFMAAHPSITLHLSTQLPGTLDFVSAGLDAAIHFGEPAYPGATVHLLRRDEIIPAASPNLLSRIAIRTIADLRKVTLIAQRSRRAAWSDWLAAHGASLDKDHPQIELEQFNMVFQAAIAGLGVAIVPTFLARQDFASGALVPLFDPLVNERRGDYLAYPDDRASYPPVVLFRDWLLAAFQRDD